MFLEDKSKILVTGASGLVGTHALLRLKDSNVQVRAVDRVQPKVVAQNIEFVQADLTKIEDCQKVVAGVDYVLMLAAKIDRRPADLSYVISTLNMNFNVLEAAYQAGVKKVVWLGSVTAYPHLDHPVKEEELFKADPPDSFFPVGWMSRYVEVLCRMYATKLKRKMSAIVLHSTAIYGEYGDFNLATCHVLPALVRKVVVRQTPIEVWGKGLAQRDFIYAGDVVDACLLALQKIEGFDSFNIGMGRSFSVKELISMIVESDNYSEAEIVFDESKPEKALAVSVDCSKAKAILGFVAKTSLREGLARTTAWLRKKQGVVNV